MEVFRVQLVQFVAAGLLLCCCSGASAAPMECHFDSRAQCVFQGRQFSLGETWMDKSCLQCTCLHPVGVGCCQTVQRPVDFPAWCQLRVEPESCRAWLVQTADPRLPCFPGDQLMEPSHGSLQLPE